MSRTITAMFDNRAEAEQAKSRLEASRIDADRIRIIDKSSRRSGAMQEEPGEQGFMASLKELFMPQEDAHAYGEGIRRGAFLLCAQVDEDQADEAIRLLDQDSSVDFDRRQDEWRSEGWQPYAGNTTGFGTASMSGDRDHTVEEERIPLVEEELRVGKREVARGGAKVRSYVVETPVHEQVNLREEHVSVERRPVDRKLERGELDRGDMLRDRTTEMTETAEEAVVGKEARVREELVIKKTAEERVEQIDDTVRRTEVDVDEGASGREARSAFGSFGKERATDNSSGMNRNDSDRTSDKQREVEGSGYSPRIDKSGL